jgi:pyruvate,water dikinase
MGTALVREGVLAEPEDIHYVTFEDLEGHARGGLPGVRLDALVAVRKEAYRGYHAAQPPHRIVCRGSVYRAAAAAALQPAVPASEDALAGIPCSPGWVCGVACVVDGGASLEAVRDRILVARVTEPGWVFLMSVARGVVVERGSLLSHAAIIGRELGVPTIVGATGATTAIRSGDEVEMNGSTGDVRILRRQGSPLHSP